MHEFHISYSHTEWYLHYFARQNSTCFGQSFANQKIIFNIINNNNSAVSFLFLISGNMVCQCMIIGCKTNQINSPGSKFYKIPKKDRKDKNTVAIRLSHHRHIKWLAAINRKNLTPFLQLHGVVCNRHFISGKFCNPSLRNKFCINCATKFFLYVWIIFSCHYNGTKTIQYTHFIVSLLSI